MTANVIANPFGLMDVPLPFDAEVMSFAAKTALAGAPDDDNAKAWTGAPPGGSRAMIEGPWNSSWNGAADPTIAGDAAGKWKEGAGEVKVVGEHVYLKFGWNGGIREGLIEAKREGAKGLIGKYINLSNPEITRPWIGLIVSKDRIDGRFPEGRLDFHR
jgi:hypothetical protein